MQSQQPQVQGWDIDAMLARSEPHPRGPWGGALTIGLIGVLIGGEWVASNNPQLGTSIHLITALLTLVLVGAMVLISSTMVRRQRAEQQAVIALEELARLHRWPEAAELAHGLLYRPMRQPVSRARVLMWLMSILTRYERHGQVIVVAEYLLSTIPMDSLAAQGVRLVRAQAMLHEDHLVDVDAAIGELRRGQSNQSEKDGQMSAELALLEIYRDIKTGHFSEAVEIFESKKELMRKQHGPRCARGWGLAACAYDRLGRGDQARDAYINATLLCDESELVRRYPEMGRLVGRYAPALVPAEVA